MKLENALNWGFSSAILLAMGIAFYCCIIRPPYSEPKKLPTNVSEPACISVTFGDASGEVLKPGMSDKGVLVPYDFKVTSYEVSSDTICNCVIDIRGCLENEYPKKLVSIFDYEYQPMILGRKYYVCSPIGWTNITLNKGYVYDFYILHIDNARMIRLNLFGTEKPKASPTKEEEK
jgi:hypothetical protein